jgi:hypothetical protein
MSNAEGMTKRCRVCIFVIRISSFIRHWSFVIRHSSFVIRHFHLSFSVVIYYPVTILPTPAPTRRNDLRTWRANCRWISE